MKITVFLLAVTAAAIAQNDLEHGTSVPKGIDPYIVGGDEVVKNSLPYQLSLRTGGSHRCGASILNANYAITAAHCAVLGPASVYTVAAGKHNIKATESTEQVRQVSEIIIHKSFNKLTWANDIALMKLSSPFELNDNVKAIAIPPSDYEIQSGDAVVSGWGTTREDGSASDVLRKVVVPVVTQESCRNSYGVSDILDTMLCAGYSAGGKDTCQGDSGGPLTISAGGDLKLIGITSFGNGCARPGFPGVYTDVAKYNSWIANHAL